MKAAWLVLLFSFSIKAGPQKAEVKYVREFISPTGSIDSTSVTFQGQVAYIDLRREISDQGFSISVLGCKVNGVVCDSPAEFKFLVSKMRTK
jgi:hypothetical protein